MRLILLILRAVLLLTALGLLIGPLRAAAQEAPGQAQAQADLAQERERITTRMAQEEAQCQQRFAVTACVDDVKRRRREALAPLRERELQREDSERQARVKQREDALADKRRAHVAEARSASAASGPSARVTVRQPGRAPATRPPAEHGVDEPPSAPSKSAELSKRAAAAAERAQSTATRQAAAQATQAAVAKRQAERASRTKLPTPLPVPATRASSAAAAGGGAGEGAGAGAGPRR